MSSTSPSGGSEGGSGRPRAVLDSLFSICNAQSGSDTDRDGRTDGVIDVTAGDTSTSEAEEAEGGGGAITAQGSRGGSSSGVRKAKMDSSSPSRGGKRSGKGKACCAGQKRARQAENVPPKTKCRHSTVDRALKAKPESGSSKGGSKKWQHRGKPGLSFACTGDGKMIGEPKTVYWHPMLSVPVCDDCHYRYHEGSFEGDDDDAAELFCRWCGGGSEGTAFLCDACPKVWCEGCILRNLGRGMVQKISGTEGIWKCFACNPGQLKAFRRSHASAWGLSFTELQRLEGDSRGGKGRNADGNGIGRNVVCEDISNGREPVPIPAINDVDNEPFPGDTFTYVADFVSDSMHLGDGNPNQLCSCDCEDGCMDPSKCACAQMMGGEFPYTLQKKLIGQREAIYECNVFCSCHAHACANRVIGKGLGQRLQVFRCPETRKGWGVRCIDDLQAGTFVIDYVGELITEKETEARKGQDSYIFSLDQAPNQYAWAGSRRHGEKEMLRQLQREAEAREQTEEEGGRAPPTTPFNTQLESFLKANWHELFEHAESTNGRNIDALNYGNVARFINHSCEPNLILQVAFTNNQDIRHPRVAFFALADIPKGTELCYDYGYGSTHWNGKKKNMKCLCGARSCQGKTL